MHVAIIMDGNGRWAVRRGLPRSAGHRRGAIAARRVIEAAPGLGIDHLTLFAFSSDNWHRPESEVNALLELLLDYLRRETPRFARRGARLRFIGRRDRLPPALRVAMRRAEETTRDQDRLQLRIAVDYSARNEIVRAARRAGTRPPCNPAEFESLLGDPSDPSLPQAVDLLIRTGGEQRLSDFLLWECAYAELLFTPTLWPDFGASELGDALTWFAGRQRRFGRIPEPARSRQTA